jgi:hypothetical protein
MITGGTPIMSNNRKENYALEKTSVIATQENTILLIHLSNSKSKAKCVLV